MSIQDLVVIDSAAGAAATCVLCGTDIAAGEGVTARLRGQTLRFKCPCCPSRFAIDPDRYLSDGTASCCDDEHANASHAQSGHVGRAADQVAEARSGRR